MVAHRRSCPCSSIRKADMSRRVFRHLSRLGMLLLFALFSSPFPLARSQEAANAPASSGPTAERIDFAADLVQIDTRASLIEAFGHVTLAHGGYRLSADHVVYREESGEVIAEGHVEIVDPDGNRLFVKRALLENDLKTGMIEAARLILKDGARLAARQVERDSVGDSRLDRAVYTPCPVCDAEPERKPLWALKAVRVVHDRKRHRLTFRNAFLTLKGVPVFWVPWLSIPDPTVDRARGFLAPDIFSRDELGLVVKLPYYLPLSRTADLTLTPMIATRETPAFAARYRQEFSRARLQVAGSITRSERPGATLFSTRPAAARGHVFARARVLHGARWDSNFDVNWTSDDTYVRLYGFSDADTLASRYRLSGEGANWRVRARLVGYQGLRIEDVAGLTAQVLPWVSAEWQAPHRPAGGTLSVTLDSLSLVRTSGADVQRESAGAHWQRRLVAGPGFVWNFDLMARGDLYRVEDASRIDDPTFAGRNGTATRGIALAAATWRWPLATTTGALYQRVEPMIQFVASPALGPEPAIPNEDSRSFALDIGNLFAIDRMPGYDRFESGPRVVYGLRYLFDPGLFRIEASAGQSRRLSRLVGQFADGTGIARRRSDVVSRLLVDLPGAVDLVYDGQFDGHTMSPRRHEVQAILRLARLSLAGGYFRIRRDLVTPDRTNREELRFEGDVRLSRRLRLTGGLIENLTSDQPIEYEAGVLYSADCLELGLTVRKRRTFDRDIKPGTSFIFRIRLRNLGG
ncbi:MAG: LPS-assembly protein LptD [Alphaproteobacteria bacterium]|nr:MAG: LPS-assembly protein LptD [Alphaproteobacteria bacterium]